MNTIRRRGFVAAGRQAAGDFQQRGRAGGVVVGAVVNVGRPGSQRARAAAAQMVVVSADDDRLVGQRTFAFQHGDDVLHLGLLLDDVRLAGSPPAGQLGAARHQVAVDLAFQRRQVLAEGSLEHGIDCTARAEIDRQLACGCSRRPRR